MRQNTKFIWIYGLILFSFALILILFAGLTQKESAHEEEKLSRSLSSLAKENSTLIAERDNLQVAVNELQLKLDAMTQEKESFYEEKEAAIIGYGGNPDVTRTLISAYQEKTRGNVDDAKALVLKLDRSSMTSAQKNLYNTIIGE